MRNIRAAIKAKGIIYSAESRLKSSKGRDNAWIIDIRRLCSDGNFLDEVADAFLELHRDIPAFQVVGMEFAAVPLLSAIILKAKLTGRRVNAAYFRKERKRTGAGRLYEGSLTNEPVVIVDDIINSGRSLEKVIAAIQSEGRQALSVFALVDFESRAGMEWRRRRRIPVRSLCTLQELELSLAPQTPAPSQIPMRPLWRFTSPNPNFYHRVPKSTPVIDGDTIYWGTDSGYLWALHLSDGSVRWRFRVSARGHKNIWSTPAACHGRVYFGSYDGNVYCLDADDGTEIWRANIADWIGSSPTLLPERDLLFIGLEFSNPAHRGSVAALRMSTGEIVWLFRSSGLVHATPILAPGNRSVLCGNNENELVKLDIETGEPCWSRNLVDREKRGSIKHAVAIDPRRSQVVAGSTDGNIYAVDLESGEDRWVVKTDNSVFAIPVVHEDMLVVGSTDKYMYLLDANDGGILKKVYANGKVFAPVEIGMGGVWYGSSSGLIQVMGFDSLSLKSTWQIQDAITNKIVIEPNSGRVLVSTYMNELLLFEIVDTNALVSP